MTLVIAIFVPANSTRGFAQIGQPQHGDADAVHLLELTPAGKSMPFILDIISMRMGSRPIFSTSMSGLRKSPAVMPTSPAPKRSSTRIVRRGVNPDVDVASVARTAVPRHRIAAANEVLNALLA
ncbi:MAG: hypothetical protein U1F71_00260 [Verrucomicrobiaceae bacterium]